MKNKLSCSRDSESDKDEKDILAGDIHTIKIMRETSVVKIIEKGLKGGRDMQGGW